MAEVSATDGGWLATTDGTTDGPTEATADVVIDVDRTTDGRDLLADLEARGLVPPVAVDAADEQLLVDRLRDLGYL